MASARKIRRRMSVDDANVALLGYVNQTIESLTDLWNKVSMDQQTREKRTQSAYTLFYSTMNEIVANEEEMVKGVFEDIERDLADVTATRQELGLAPFPDNKYQPNSIALLKALGKDKKSLEERKRQAMAKQLEEFNELVKLCRCLGEPVPEVEGIEDKILPRSQVDEIVRMRVNSRKELEMRKAKFDDLQSKIKRRHPVVKNITLSEDERNLFTFDLADPSMVFSVELMDRFNDLLEKFEVEYEKWRENVVFQYLECYTELAALSENCYAEDLLHSYPEAIDLDIHDESLLENIKRDIQILKQRYENGRPLFDKFAQWHSAFKMQQKIEETLNTDRVRKNRGGCLAGVLKDQKKTNASAELYLRQLREACEKQADSGITIEDLSPYQFALRLIQERGQQKENERELRKANKARQLHMDAKFGTSQSSPSLKSCTSFRQVSMSPFSKTPKSPYPKSPFRRL